MMMASLFHRAEAFFYRSERIEQWDRLWYDLDIETDHWDLAGSHLGANKDGLLREHKN
jgi:hypothetical protein